MNFSDPWQHMLSLATLVIFLGLGLFAIFVRFIVKTFFSHDEQDDVKPPEPLAKTDADKMVELLVSNRWRIQDIIGYYTHVNGTTSSTGTSLKFLHGGYSIEVFFSPNHPQEKNLDRFIKGEVVKFERNSLPIPESGDYYPATFLVVSLD